MADDADQLTTPIRRILCIDGGGIKGTCPAAFLAGLEEELDQPIGHYFDLIAGTSTGGILAIGLALGHSAKELLTLYEEEGPNIFGQPVANNTITKISANVLAGLRHWVSPKHDLNNLEAALKSVLQDARIGEAKTRILVPSWDADSNSIYIYKTAHHKRLTKDYKRPALDAALATAAAPTYFKQHRTVDHIGLIDGGVWSNNPTGIAAVEGITLLGWPASSLRILSLGCIDEVEFLPQNSGKLGLGWKGRAINLLMKGQSSGSLGIAKLITDHPHSGQALYRYSPRAPSNFFKLDDTSKIQRLRGLGASSARKASQELKEVFFDRPAEPFKPVYELEDLQ